MLLTGLRHSGRNLITPPICTCIKKFSYKVVKRPNFLNKPDTERKYVDKQLADKSIVLADHIRARIKLGGPITIADYMKEVLINPVSGYYMAKDVFGQHGDFITSPEIGQIFGEMIAIWCLTEWQKVGAPAPLQIVELGPGRGTLMQDILRVFAQLKLNKEFSLHLVEMSTFLSKSQAHLLCISNKEVQGMNHYREGETASGVKVRWYRQFNDIPDGFKILLAHEFFDALPIHKLLKDKDRWREMLIDIDPKNEKCFRYIQSKEETPVSKLFKTICNKDETREVVELSLEGDSILKTIANKFEEHGGIGLIMDYGHFGEKGDTFRVCNIRNMARESAFTYTFFYRHLKTTNFMIL